MTYICSKDGLEHSTTKVESTMIFFMKYILKDCNSYAYHGTISATLISDSTTSQVERQMGNAASP